MADQIKKLVDEGSLLNYDACFQNNTVGNLAAQNPVANDDLNLSSSKDRLCRIYYNNAFWRGGVNGGIDDRIKSASSSGWNTNSSQRARSTIGNIKSDFDNNVNRARQAIVSFRVYGNMNDANNVTRSKADIENNISKIRAENAKLETVLASLKKENSEEMLQQVADNEENIRQLSNENYNYRKGNELRREQSKDLYTRYDSNFHSSAFGYFGYNPIHHSSQSALVFTSFFMGFVGLIALGVHLVPLLSGYMGGSKGSTQVRPVAATTSAPAIKRTGASLY